MRNLGPILDTRERHVLQKEKKHSSLFGPLVSYDEKGFATLAPGCAFTERLTREH
jgi:hypothetical protein